MKLKALLTLSLLPIMTATAANAAIEKRYVATPTQSQWEMVSNSPLECRLVHPIPNFGDAEFIARASKKMNLDFELKNAPLYGRNSKCEFGVFTASMETG